MIGGIETLRLRALALRSSVHNEQQLSAIELAGMTAKKTNELIDVINELCDIVDNIVTENGLIITYDENNEGLTLGVTE